MKILVLRLEEIRVDSLLEGHAQKICGSSACSRKKKGPGTRRAYIALIACINKCNALRNLHIDPHVLRIIREFHHETAAQIEDSSKLSDPINITKGLRQGHSISPRLFNLYV